jgi:hypothetical protein
MNGDAADLDGAPRKDNAHFKDGALSKPAPPKPAAPVAAPAAAVHPLFAPKSDSPFADKLKQALLPAGPKQDS